MLNDTHTPISEHPAVVVFSFGFGHGRTLGNGPGQVEADLVIDARWLFRNPHRDPAMRQMTGLDRAVADHVDATPGVRRVVDHTIAQVVDLVQDTNGFRTRPVRVAVGCVGGRHRSVAMAEAIGAGLRESDVDAKVEHWDVHKPVIQR